MASKRLAPFIQESLDRTGLYFEPFVGGNNFFWRLSHDGPAYLSDIDQSLITLYTRWLEGWRPPTTVTRETYQEVKDKNDPLDPITAFVAYGCSYSGMRFAGYASGRPKQPNYAENASNSLARTVKQAEYVCTSYRRFAPKNATVYCDPPYLHTAGYRTVEQFDHVEFYRWCNRGVSKGCDIFVSELEGPDHWEVVYEENRSMKIGTNRRMRSEKLYRVHLHG